MALLIGMASSVAVNAAGLSLSSVPLFVTEVLAPNVILSPAYLFNATEVSMKDLPWDVLDACGKYGNAINRDLCPDQITTGDTNDAPAASIMWKDSTSYGDPYWADFGAPFSLYTKKDGPWRVTPWPLEACPDGTSKGCFRGAVYPDDSEYIGENMNIGRWFEAPYGKLFKNGFAVKNYEPALMKYVRSNKNFLYFNEDLVSVYQPWPTLGNKSFPSYVLDKDSDYYAGTPFYTPFDQSLKATLGEGQQYYYSDDIDHNPRRQIIDAFIGKYYVHKGGEVWRASHYTEKNVIDGSDDALDKQVAFAHWFSYWRSSYLAARGMMGSVISELQSRDLLTRFRLGLQYGDSENRYFTLYAINNDNQAAVVQSLADKIYGFDTGFDYWDPRKTRSFFQNSGPYKDTPDDTTNTWTGARSCRRNYEIVLMPDYTLATGTGIVYKGRQGIPNADETFGAPYADGYTGTWGDVGAHGWKPDLTPLLEDNLLKGKQDEATWQHLVRYIVAPKASGDVFSSQVRTYDEALAVLKANPANEWPVFNYATPKAFVVDDLWHMALNSRGMLFSSENIKTAIDDVLSAFNDILLRNVSGSAVATNTTSLQTGGYVYQATVENDWRGHLRAYRINKLTRENSNIPYLEVDYTNPVWDLAESVSVGVGSRKIFSYNRDSHAGVTFTWAAVGATTQGEFEASFAGDDAGVKTAKAMTLVDYLRGAGTCEDGAATTCTAGGDVYTFRRRNLNRSNTYPYRVLTNQDGRNLLGDIANSNPWLVSPPLLGVSDVDYPGYNAHRIAYKDRPRMLYVGANDGMLHAVRAEDYVVKDANGVIISTSPAGQEVFAYIPSFVQKNLPLLSQVTYPHEYYVDGSPLSAEVDLTGDGRGWKTVLAGGANLGGRGYYLLDVTNPNSLSESAASAASLVRWEFTSANDADLQYTYNMPVAHLDGHARAGQARQIVRMNDGKWAVILGNGYQRADPDNPGQAAQRACLFVLYLSGPGEGNTWTNGTHYRKYCVGDAGYSADRGLDTNGLSTPTPYDLNGDGSVDVVYAGDLNGNLWRFNFYSKDVRNPGSTADWGVAYGGSPLFVAKNSLGNRQPIIAPPEVTRYSLGAKSGQFILFGTGKYIEGSDRTNTAVQSFYGIWDRGYTGYGAGESVEASFSNLGRASLKQQIFTAVSVTLRKQASRVPPDYCDGANLDACGDTKQLGWFWDMLEIGERMTGRVNLFNGMVYFNTFYPALDPLGGVDANGLPALDPCKYGGDGWIMGLNAVGGYMEDEFPVFDVNQDGVVDSSDPNSGGVKIGAAIGGTTFARGVGDGNGKVGVYSPSDLGTAASEGKRMTITTTGLAGSKGRVSWYELLD